MSTDPQETRERRIAEALTAPITSLGLDLEAVEINPAGKRRVLRVAVDQDGGVTLDEVAEATRAVEQVLEGESGAALMGEHPYTLEVTSRGVERPLTHPRHWRRNAGRLVKATLTDGSSLTGRVVEAEEEPTGGVVVEVSGHQRRLDYDEVRRALVQVELDRKEPGGAGPGADGDEQSGVEG